MTFFDKYQETLHDLVDETGYNQQVQEEELFMEESEMKWAVTDFCTQVQKHGILEMGRLVLEELRKRGYSG